jgi:hypothetical protein
MYFPKAVTLEINAEAAKRLNITSSKTLKDFKTFGVLNFRWCND